MKKTLYIILFALPLLLLTCQKHPELKIYNLEITDEAVESSTTTAEITVKYTYPTKLEYVNAYVSMYGDMSHAVMSQASISNDAFSVTFNNLRENTTYFYRFEYSNGVNLIKTEIRSFATEGLSLPSAETYEVESITSNSVTCNGKITSNGGGTINARGFCWSKNQNPTVNDNVVLCYDSLGLFSKTIYNLDENTTYYVKAFATNEKGTGYGEQKSFTTLANAVIPTVSTDEVTSITSVSAVCGGNVISNGGGEISANGLCWSENANPTINDNVVVCDGDDFSATIYGLSANTTYFVKAYATNEKGTGYGEQKTFTTLANNSLPTVTTKPVTNITSNSASCGGNVTDDGGMDITERGICWSTEHNPTINDPHTSDGTGIGEFLSQITELNSNVTYYVRAYATSDYGTAYGNEHEFTTEAGLPVVTTKSVTNITPTSASCGGEVTSDGGGTVTERGVCWSTSQNPTTTDSHTSDGTGTGQFDSAITGLTVNTTYYVRAYAKNQSGTVYGEQRSFMTQDGLAVVTTNNVSNITANSATSGGNITDDGGFSITARGVCWSTNQNPTTNDSHTSDGTGTGSYSSSLTSLSYNTTYYVRAYATNSKGTSYGEEKTFTTSKLAPTVTTAEVSGVTTTSAVCGGNVTNDGGGSVTARGVCWSTSQNPTVSGSHTSDGNGTGAFTSNITGLNENTTYYVRAYATNSEGTSYGSQKTFTTPHAVTTPTVSTNNVTGITANTAVSGGNVTSAGYGTVSAKGVCWSTSQNPTISDAHSTDGSGTGSFTSTLTGLSEYTTYYVRAYATNEAGTAYGEQKTFTTEHTTTLPSVTTSNVTDVTSNTAVSGGNVTSSGYGTVTARGVCWSISQNPTISDAHTTDGNGTGVFTSTITGLSEYTTYYLRAYATNEAGTSYGEQKTFTTEHATTIPTVTTNNVTDITQTTAVSGGNVTSSGYGTVSARGVCWSTAHNPIVSGNHTTNGTGTGTFTSNITGLTANTTYYVRAYATNSAGTAYGTEFSFTTLQNVTVPTVTTSQITDITATTAVSGGNVTADGGANVTARGICWATTANPTITNSHTSNGTGTGNYVSNMTGLSANTIYHVRAYATNSAGTVYGDDISFTTTPPQAPTGAINGLFSVSATQQVWFSQGNLQYIGSTAVPCWKFADNQYDCLWNNGQSAINPNKNRDLFGWGTSGYDHGANCYQPWCLNANNSDYYAYGNYQYNLNDQTGKADWGYNAISNGGNTENQWRCLSKLEWDYLLFSRLTTSNIRFAKAIINSICGVIILPDDWDSNNYGLSNANNIGASFNSNVISASQWNTIEEYGAVFVPAAGYCCYSSYVDGLNTFGFYWSESYYDGDKSSRLGFNNETLDTGADNRYYRFSVRLVQDY